MVLNYCIKLLLAEQVNENKRNNYEIVSVSYCLLSSSSVLILTIIQSTCFRVSSIPKDFWILGTLSSSFLEGHDSTRTAISFSSPHQTYSFTESSSLGLSSPHFDCGPTKKVEGLVEFGCSLLPASGLIL